MRLVLGYLVQRCLLWSFLLTTVAFALLALCQFLLTERVNYVSSLSHALYFAALYGGAFVIVQWRKRKGDVLLEGMGYPRWSIPLPIGLISGALIVTALSQLPTPGLSKTGPTQLHWHGSQADITINANELNSDHQHAIFAKLVGATEDDGHPPWMFLIAILIPVLLYQGLISWTSPHDTWMPLLVTTSTFAALEFWVRGYG